MEIEQVGESTWLVWDTPDEGGRVYDDLLGQFDSLESASKFLAWADSVARS